MRILAWFSCGINSASMVKLALKKYPELIPVYCDTHSEHLDNYRFLKDCEKWFKKRIEIIKSKQYKNVNDVFEKTRYMAGIHGARCTTELKKIPRFEFQKPDDLHLFGFTVEEWKRAKTFIKNNPELLIEFPLIENLFTKEDCFKYVPVLPPVLYSQGFEHSNCIGCPKSSSPAYWNKIRELYPDVFKLRCEQSRKLNVRLILYRKKRIFLDQLPGGIKFGKIKEENCNAFCSVK